MIEHSLRVRPFKSMCDRAGHDASCASRIARTLKQVCEKVATSSSPAIQYGNRDLARSLVVSVRERRSMTRSLLFDRAERVRDRRVSFAEALAPTVRTSLSMSNWENGHQSPRVVVGAKWRRPTRRSGDASPRSRRRCRASLMAHKDQTRRLRYSRKGDRLGRHRVRRRTARRYQRSSVATPVKGRDRGSPASGGPIDLSKLPLLLIPP